MLVMPGVVRGRTKQEAYEKLQRLQSYALDDVLIGMAGLDMSAICVRWISTHWSRSR